MSINEALCDAARDCELLLADIGNTKTDAAPPLVVARGLVPLDRIRTRLARLAARIEAAAKSDKPTR